MLQRPHSEIIPLQPLTFTKQNPESKIQSIICLFNLLLRAAIIGTDPIIFIFVTHSLASYHPLRLCISFLVCKDLSVFQLYNLLSKIQHRDWSHHFLRDMQPSSELVESSSERCILLFLTLLNFVTPQRVLLIGICTFSTVFCCCQKSLSGLVPSSSGRSSLRFLTTLNFSFHLLASNHFTRLRIF